MLNYKHVSKYVASFDEYSSYYASLLDERIDGCTFDIKPYVARCTIDIFLGKKKSLVKDNAL